MRTLTLLPALCLAACGANPYGYAPEYAPLDDEESYIEGAQELSYEEVRRNPLEYSEMLLGWFAAAIIWSIVVQKTMDDRVANARKTHRLSSKVQINI